MKKQIGIIVKGKVLRLSDPQSFMVCANKNGYEIAFQFDAEWDANAEKTARFIWGGKYTDVKFTGSVCPAPAVYKSYSCEVGLLLADEATTTTVAIPCKPSARCGTNTPHPEYIMPPAELVVQTAENIGELKGDVMVNSVRISALERNAGLADFVDVLVVTKEQNYINGTGEDDEPTPMLLHIMGSQSTKVQDTDDYFEMLDIYGEKPQPNYQRGINVDSNNGILKETVPRVDVLLPPAEEMQEMCPFLGYGSHWYDGHPASFVSENFSKYANFIFFEGGKAYYYQGAEYKKCALDSLSEAEQERIVMEWLAGDGTANKFLIGLEEPIITDISDYVLTTDGNKFDGMFYRFPNGADESEFDLRNACPAEVMY